MIPRKTTIEIPMPAFAPAEREFEPQNAGVVAGCVGRVGIIVDVGSVGVVPDVRTIDVVVDVVMSVFCQRI